MVDNNKSGENLCDAEDKGLTSMIYKELIQIGKKRANNPKEIMAKDMNRQFTKEGSRVATNKGQRCSHA